jgi:hypothetical protein
LEDWAAAVLPPPACGERVGVRGGYGLGQELCGYAGPLPGLLASLEADPSPCNGER